jgi:hypothetical protein
MNSRRCSPIADGQTSYEGLIAAASNQIQTILSMLT